MSAPMTIELDVRFPRCGRSGRRQAEPGAAPAVPLPAGRVPRVARLLALALRLEPRYSTTDTSWDRSKADFLGKSDTVTDCVSSGANQPA
jgi:hypothetical protein